MLQKFNKIIVTDVKEFEAAQSAREFKGMTLQAGVMASYAIGTMWQDANYQGSSHTFTTTNSATCYGQTYSFSFPSITSSLHDQVSSFNSQGGCQTRLYEHIQYGGSYYGYVNCRSNLGTTSFNDKASSVRFFLTTTYSCY